ncbi:MAG: hypothetical protein SGILL_007139 [Bacillariaceae sp.]
MGYLGIPDPRQFAGGGDCDELASSCGNEFDAYVRKVEGTLAGAFMFAPPSSRELEFWKGRKCRFYLTKDKVVECSVQGWTQNLRRGFMGTYEISWMLTLEGDGLVGLPTLNNGDGTQKQQVTIDKKPKAHDGKTGIIVQDLPGNRYKIQLDEDSLKFVTVHKDNLIRKPRKVTFLVHRMNVQGGGVVKYCHCESVDCLVPAYSIEWIDDALPAVDLYGSVAKATCPTCRAVEPTEKAFDDRDVDAVTGAVASPKKRSPSKKGKALPTERSKASPEKPEQDIDASCPICTMEKPLRTLQCGHQLCQDCWSQWRAKATSKLPFGVTQPEIDDDELQKTRDREYQKLRALLPHTRMDGTATKAHASKRNSSRSTTLKRNRESIDAALEKFGDRLHSIMERLDDAAHSYGTYEDGDYKENLGIFWTELRKAPVHVFCFSDELKHFLGNFFNDDGIEIMLQVIQERADEIEAGRYRFLWSEWEEMKKETDVDLPILTDQDLHERLEAESKGHIQNMMSACHNRTGETWEEDREYDSAIYWYERAVFTQLKRLELETGFGTETEIFEEITKFYNNLALANKRAGKLSKALEHYNTGLEYAVGPEEEEKEEAEQAALQVHLVQNKCTLIREMLAWTGTSEKLTPGC